MTNKGKLILIPSTIADNAIDTVRNPELIRVLPSIQHFLVEDVRTARRYLSSLKIFPSIEELQFSILDKKSERKQVEQLFAPALNGFDLGVISESGCPGVADPGALAVEYAHANGFEVLPLVGPSSILMALMSSGLNGQKFAFHGYLPIDGKECSNFIREYEKESQSKNQTQIFIETPYRNNSVFQNLLKNLKNETLLCVAFDLTGESQFIKTFRVKQWRDQPLEFGKKPAVFLFLA
jgi:16S rRNA (cytidine1402-2'-O)-methyltransferase